MAWLPASVYSITRIQHLLRVIDFLSARTHAHTHVIEDRVLCVEQFIPAVPCAMCSLPKCKWQCSLRYVGTYCN